MAKQDLNLSEIYTQGVLLHKAKLLDDDTFNKLEVKVQRSMSSITFTNVKTTAENRAKSLLGRGMAVLSPQKIRHSKYFIYRILEQ